MPIYEYRCDACGHELEKIQRMSDAPLTDCPDCGEAELRRLVSAAAFRLKGSGWYVNDYGKGNGGRSSALAKTEDTESAAPQPDSKPKDTPTQKASEKSK